MFRKELFDTYIPAEDYIKLRFPLEDWPTWLILSKYTKIGYLPVSTATYRYGHESITNPHVYEKFENRLYSEKKMIEYLCKLFPQDFKYSEEYISEYIDLRLLNLAYKLNDFSSANKYALLLTKKNNRTFKVRSAKYFITFKFFLLLKKIRNFSREYL